MIVEVTNFLSEVREEVVEVQGAGGEGFLLAMH